MSTSFSLLRRGRAAGAALIVLAALAGGVALQAAPVAAAGPAATAASPTATAAVAIPQAYGATVPITGHGFGHGEGMGQWGAYGYATQYQWSWQQILAHYYGGTTLSGVDGAQPISVRLQALDDRPFTAFVQEKGLMATNADGGVGRFRSLVVVETAAQGLYTVWGRVDGPVCPNPAAPFNPAGWVQVSAGRRRRPSPTCTSTSSGQGSIRPPPIRRT